VCGAAGDDLFSEFEVEGDEFAIVFVTEVEEDLELWVVVTESLDFVDDVGEITHE
jgi:hypothetical protein